MSSPTITIDTSAVSNMSPPQAMDSDAVAMRALSNSPSTLHGEPISPGTYDGAGSQARGHQSNQASRSSIPELRATTSFDSRESRPTSPHNVSSPTSRGDTTQGF